MKMIENLEGRQLYSVSTVVLAAPADPAPAPPVEAAGTSASASIICTTLTNLANMRHEMLKAVAQNLRA